MGRAHVSISKPVIVLAAAFLFGCSGANRQVSRADVQLAAGDLRTFAASAQMLVEQCSAKRATETFCREQADLVSTKVDRTMQDLDGQAGEAEFERSQVADIGARLREIVLRVEQSSTQAGDAEAAGRLAKMSKTIEETLRK
jgi:hypothetical protein